MFKFIYIFVVFISVSAYGNDTVDEIIELSEAKVEYTEKIKTLFENNPFKVPLITVEGTSLYTETLEMNLKSEELLHSYLSWGRVRALMKEVYLKTFTQEELEYLVVIFSTDLGKSIMLKDPIFNKNLEELTQKLMEDFQVEQKKLNDEYSRITTQYINERKSALKNK